MSIDLKEVLYYFLMNYFFLSLYSKHNSRGQARKGSDGGEYALSNGTDWTNPKQGKALPIVEGFNMGAFKSSVICSTY